MKIQGVLFDFDGTLTKPGAIDFTAIKQAIGCPPHQAILEYLETTDDARKRKLMEIVEEMEQAAASKSIPNHGAVSTLSWLKKRSLPFGVVTRNGASSIRIAMERFHPINEADFGTIITREHAAPKPSPAGLIEAARRLAIVAKQTLFVGDFRFDVMAGAGAGMITVLLTNGNPVAFLPDDPQPHYRISHLEELRTIIEEADLKSKGTICDEHLHARREAPTNS